jgi:hypothetical protein
MQMGRLEQIIKVPIPRPRDDLAANRGTSEFAEVRYEIWRALHAKEAVH